MGKTRRDLRFEMQQWRTLASAARQLLDGPSPKPAQRRQWVRQFDRVNTSTRRVCLGCGVQFDPVDGRQKYCETECGRRARWARFSSRRARDYEAEYAKRKAREVNR